MTNVSINQNAVRLVNELLDKVHEYNLTVERNETGAYILDARSDSRKGFLLGKAIAEICLGGLGTITICSTQMGKIYVPGVNVSTDHPAISLLGSQLAGWKIETSDYSALGSGPARALVMKPKSIYKKIDYKDEYDKAVLVLESENLPTAEASQKIAEFCGVSMDNLYLISVSGSSVAGATQVSARVVEVGMYKLQRLGLDPKLVTYAWGEAPIMPLHPDPTEAMGRNNDAIICGGKTYYVMDYDGSEKDLRDLVKNSVSSISKLHGKPFAQIFKEAEQDFYKVDPDLFAPAVLAVCNSRTGKTFTAGAIDEATLERSVRTNA